MGVTPRDRKFGAKGDGVHDDGPALQKWLDAIAGKTGFLDARYASAQHLVVHPDTTIYAYHRAVAGLYAHPLFDPGEEAFLRIQQGGGVNLHNVDIVGSPRHREGTGAALIIQNSNDVTLTGCGLSWFHHLVTPAATSRLHFYACDFGHWSSSVLLPSHDSPEGRAIIEANKDKDGKPIQPLTTLMLRGNCQFNGGYAILGGNNDWPNKDVEVIGCLFHDGLWTAIDCLGPNNVHWKIIDTSILRVHEAGIYLGVNAIIDRVTIIGVTQRDCSAHCIEGGGIGGRVTNSVFGRPDAAIAFLANPIDFYFGHNKCYDGMEGLLADLDPPLSPWSSALFVRNIGPIADDLVSDGLMVEDNDFSCSTGKMTHMIYMYDGGAGPYRNTMIRANRRHGKWGGQPLVIDEAAKGPNFYYSEAQEITA